MATIDGSSFYGDLGSSYRLQQPAQKDRQALGQEEFLKLMLTQFRNQDPLKPQDPAEFLSQLAQVSSVTGIAEMKNSIATLADSLYAGQALQAASVVGRSVLAPSDAATLAAGETVRGAVDLPASTQAGFVRVLDGSGALVREIPLGPRAAGLASFEWDGRTATGQGAAPGSYRIVAGYRSSGQEIAADTFVAKRVASVALGGDGGRTEITTTDNQTLGLGEVRAIY
ncbi:MAG: flagellar hook assembly protein FlgD [Gammaproteobacteria bacterium]|nr:flagellar hook assembly protein FlgD [Gammaproteobacteria bacterium]